MIQTLTCRMEIASCYGLDCAIFMHHITYWVMRNQSEEKHFYDGRYWAYASYAGLVRWFEPLWSLQQVKRIVAKCKAAGILLTANYNKTPMERTNWYSPSDNILAIYMPEDHIQGVVRNRTMHSSESNHVWSEIEPVNIDNINKKINAPPKAPQGGRARAAPKRAEPKKAPDWKPERFTAFWEAYPRGEKKQAAIAAWDKLHADEGLLNLMAMGLKRQLSSEDWKRGIGIPYASTWLNQRRWEDEEKGPGRGAAEPAPAWAEDQEVRYV